ncbi:MAG: hypothetical protein WAT92_19055 [Saprospiraceae bacterium]
MMKHANQKAIIKNKIDAIIEAKKPTSTTPAPTILAPGSVVNRFMPYTTNSKPVALVMTQ